VEPPYGRSPAGSRPILPRRATTNRAARHFALACKLLPRALRDDVYLLYLVFRTLDDLVDESRPGAAESGAAVEAWAHGRRTRHARGHAARGAVRAPSAPACGARRLLRGHALGSARDAVRDGSELDAYCYRVAGTVGIVMAAVLGTTDDARARPARPRWAWRCSARTSCATRRGRRRRAPYLARETTDRLGAPAGAREKLVRDQIARADARYEEGLAGVALLRSGRGACAAAGWMYRGSCARSSARATGRGPAGRRARRRKLWVAARHGLTTLR
jgi:phytoene synthase